MKGFIEFTKTVPFRVFFEGLLSLEEASEIIHGVYIDLHPLWRKLQDDLLFYGEDSQFFFSEYWLLHSTVSQEVFNSSRMYDVTEKNFWWSDYCSRVGKDDSPFIVRVDIEPCTSRTLNMRKIITDYCHRQPFFYR